jgi:hypothetical protein
VRLAAGLSRAMRGRYWVGESLTVDVLAPQRNVMVISGVIGQASDQGLDVYGEDPADAYITNMVIAHEVGHPAHIPTTRTPRATGCRPGRGITPPSRGSRDRSDFPGTTIQ